MEQQPSEERAEGVGSAEQFQIVALEMDYAASVGRIYRSDGLHADFPMTGEKAKSAIASALLVPDAPAMLVRTIQGDEFAVELPMLGDMATLAGRPVVYLDQQAWSKLARVETMPVSLKAYELAAARWLIELARDRRVILPYSAAGNRLGSCSILMGAAVTTSPSPGSHTTLGRRWHPDGCWRNRRASIGEICPWWSPVALAGGLDRT